MNSAERDSGVRKLMVMGSPVGRIDRISSSGSSGADLRGVKETVESSCAGSKIFRKKTRSYPYFEKEI